MFSFESLIKWSRIQTYSDVSILLGSAHESTEPFSCPFGWRNHALFHQFCQFFFDFRFEIAVDCSDWRYYWRDPYEKVPWYNHGATMVYHGKQWYTMVLCDRTMVHPCATMVYCKRTMVHPCVTMVQAWYKKLVPWYIMVYHGTLYLYHSASICNHMEQFTCTMVYYGIPSYIFIPPWYKYLIPWYATVYHITTLCYYGTSMAQITYTMVSVSHGMLSLMKIYYSTTLQRRATRLSA